MSAEAEAGDPRSESVPAPGVTGVARGALLRSAVGIGIYAGTFALSFGAVAVGSGLSVAQTMLLSAVMFSGASQFAFVGVAAVAASPFAAVPAALLLAVRNGFYGVPVSKLLQPSGWRRPWAAHFVIDETTAMAVAQPSESKGRYAFWATGLILFACWVSGSLAGALIGSAIDPRTFGLDAAAPAVFLALLWPGLRSGRARWVAAGGALVALVLIPLAPAGVPVLAAAGVALAGGLIPARGSRA